MKTEKPISIGLCLQVMIDTIGQDCLLDYLATSPSSKDYQKQKQKFARIKKRETFDPTTIKNLEEFAKFEIEWAKWLIEDGYANGITMNYVDQFLVNFAKAAQALELAKANGKNQFYIRENSSSYKSKGRNTSILS